jgi:ribosome recycling factor
METVDLEALFEDTKGKMAKAVAHTEEEFASIRTGRAMPALLDRIMVEYFQSEVPLRSLAGVNALDARTLVINPYDKGALGAIEKAIRDSDLGVNPTNDGSAIRITFQPPTEERRKELIKVVRQKAEDGRVAIRSIRRSARHQLDGWQKQGEITTDDLSDMEKRLEALTHKFIQELDRALENKEHDLLEV